MGLYIIGNHQFILQACHADMIIIYLCSVLWSYRVWQQFMKTHEIRQCDMRLLMYVLLLATINAPESQFASIHIFCKNISRFFAE